MLPSQSPLPGLGIIEEETPKKSPKKGEGETPSCVSPSPEAARPPSGNQSPTVLKPLSKLRHHTNMALHMLTGKKLTLPANNEASKNNYIIPGFGYAMLDIFENDFVYMEHVTNLWEEAKAEEVRSPFQKRRQSPSKMSKEEAREYKRRRREEKKREQEERERRAAMPPAEYHLFKIKTSVGKYPTLNITSPFTNEEIKTGKRCKLNRWKKPSDETAYLREGTVETVREGGFKLSLNPVEESVRKGDASGLDASKQASVAEGTVESERREPEKPPVVEPKTRAAGGVWLHASDFPHCF